MNDTLLGQVANTSGWDLYIVLQLENSCFLYHSNDFKRIYMLFTPGLGLLQYSVSKLLNLCSRVKVSKVN